MRQNDTEAYFASFALDAASLREAAKG